MKKFNWVQGIALGVFVWAIMALFVWSAIALGVFSTLWAQIAMVALAGGVSFFFALGIDYDSYSRAFQYGLTFVVVGAVLDLIVTLQMLPALFSMWMYWVGYALILIAPMLQITRQHSLHTTEAHAH